MRKDKFNPLLCLSTIYWENINQLTCPPGNSGFRYHVWLPCKTEGICIGTKTRRVSWIYPNIQCNLLCVSQVKADSSYRMQLRLEGAHLQAWVETLDQDFIWTNTQMQAGLTDINTWYNRNTWIGQLRWHNSNIPAHKTCALNPITPSAQTGLSPFCKLSPPCSLQP